MSLSLWPLALQLLDLLADGAGFLFGIPGGVDLTFSSSGSVAFGEQRLAEPALVVGDQCEAAPRICAVER